MKPPQGPHALYYPFHLCHPETLRQLLARFATVHFRDFMALQLTPMSGMTAFHERMGGDFPDLVATGRLVQGYNVSGPLAPDLIADIDHDLSDDPWRRLFHQALSHNRRFQRGLFDVSHSMQIGTAPVPGPAALLQLMDEDFQQRPFRVEDIQQLSRTPLTAEQGYQFEYGLALIKTSASLAYTIRLATQHDLIPVTDSPAHFALFEQSMRRNGRVFPHHLVIRQGY
jgi:hypothetical protein